MATNTLTWKGRWAQDVWSHVRRYNEQLAKQGSQVGVGTTFKEDSVLERLTRHGEARNVGVNLGWITVDPDLYQDFTWDKLEKLSRQLWFGETGPEAPALWPRGFNVALVAHSTSELPPKQTWRPYALGAVVLSFWRALAAAHQAGNQEVIDGFLKLARTGFPCCLAFIANCQVGSAALCFQD